jgi:hypothetical protein
MMQLWQRIASTSNYNGTLKFIHKIVLNFEVHKFNIV